MVFENIFYSFALGKPPGHKIFKEPRVKLFKKVNEYDLSHITFYPENHDHRAVYLNGKNDIIYLPTNENILNK